MKVFVTGSASCLARALLPRLCSDPNVTGVTGLDIAPTGFRHGKLRAIQLDMRDARLPILLKGHDAVVHLAFVVLRGRMRAKRMHAINVGASMGVFQAARSAGVKLLVHLSSAAVYGAGAELDEQAPLTPLPGFLYAHHKAELEQRLATSFPDCVRLRPHVILGPHAQPLLKTLLRQPFHVRLPDPQPLLQCVHEDDVADAVLRCLREEKSGGVYNLASEEPFSFRDAIANHGNRTSLALPPSVASAGLGLAWLLFGWGGEPGWIKGIARTLTLDSRRARDVLGWRPRFSGRQILDSMHSAR